MLIYGFLEMKAGFSHLAREKIKAAVLWRWFYLAEVCMCTSVRIPEQHFLSLRVIVKKTKNTLQTHIVTRSLCHFILIINNQQSNICFNFIAKTCLPSMTISISLSLYITFVFKCQRHTSVAILKACCLGIKWQQGHAYILPLTLVSDHSSPVMSLLQRSTL